MRKISIIFLALCISMVLGSSDVFAQVAARESTQSGGTLVGVISVLLFLGIMGLLITKWSREAKAEAEKKLSNRISFLITTVLIGLFSLVPAIILGIPLCLLLGNLDKMFSAEMSVGMSAAPLLVLFIVLLIICALGFFAVLELSVVSVIKMIGVRPGDAQKNLKKTFQVAVPVSAITLITVMFSPIVKLEVSSGGITMATGMTIAQALFSEYRDFPAHVCLILCSLLILARGIAGLRLLKKEQGVTSEQEPKILSNRISLSVTSVALSLVSFCVTGWMVLLSFFGIGNSFSGLPSFIQLIGQLDNISPAPLIALFAVVLIICSLGFMAVLSISSVPAIMTKALNPEKAQKFFKKTFSIAVTVSVITLITILLGSIFKVRETEYTIVKFLFNGDAYYLKMVVISFGLVLLLGIAGLLLLEWSKIVSVKANKSELDTQNQNVETGGTIRITKEDIGKGAEAVKQKTLTIYQSVFDKAKAILFNPKETWTTIESENTPHTKVFTSYVLPLTAIVAVAAFIGFGLIGYWVHSYHVSSTSWGFKMAIILAITMAGGVYLTVFVINALSENFGSRKDFNKAFSLVAYAYTPALVGGIFYIIPNIAMVASLASIYSLYLLYIGLQPMMQTPEEKKTPYFVISLICLVVVYFVFKVILTNVLLGSTK